MDSPAVYLAKFGIVGVLLLFGTIHCYHQCAKSLRALVGWTPAHTALRAFAISLVALSPFGGVTEDKGTAMGALLTLSLLLAQANSFKEQDVINAASAEPTGASLNVLEASARVTND